MVFPVMMYGCETWTLRKSDQRRIEAFEMWCWRRMLKIPWTDKTPNTQVLMYAQPKMPLLSLVVKHQLTYFGHIMRANGLEKNIMLGKVTGRRRRGRQRMRWLGTVEKEAGLNLNEMRWMVEDRSGWRAFIHQIARSRARLDGL